MLKVEYQNLQLDYIPLSDFTCPQIPRQRRFIIIQKGVGTLLFDLVEVLDYLLLYNEAKPTPIGYNKPIKGMYTIDVGVSCSLPLTAQNCPDSNEG